MKQRILSLNTVHDSEGVVVVYVMGRDQRVHDNHALLAAQDYAARLGLPLMVAFRLLAQSGVRSREHYQFMVDGLRQLAAELEKYGIPFVVVSDLDELCAEVKPAALYFDFSPLRGPRTFQKSFAETAGFPVYVVDTHNIIPVWELSDHEEFAAHTIRRKVHKQLAQWLTEPPKLQPQSHAYQPPVSGLTWSEVDGIVQNVPACGISVTDTPGGRAARVTLDEFMDNRLLAYAVDRNDATTNGQTGLSPYLHFGQISALRVALELQKQPVSQPPLLLREPRLASSDTEPTLDDSVDALLEELIVRKELADNYCFYKKNYDNLLGAKPWAQKTLAAHANDAREFVYSQEQWEAAQTHDSLWNAAQRQLLRTGKIHGYMRMYWAKKLLEWSRSPEDAIAYAVYLNDHYSVDGGDPNGYVGIMWSIAGLHDRPWFDREVYGTVRYMATSGASKRFDISEYIQTWS
jgi:deoxyribodipyrimidine photo-lyase